MPPTREVKNGYFGNRGLDFTNTVRHIVHPPQNKGIMRKDAKKSETKGNDVKRSEEIERD